MTKFSVGFTLTLLALSGTSAFAKVEKPQAEITFTQSAARPKYWIANETDGKTTLFFQDGKQKPEQRSLGTEEARSIEAEMQRLVWDSLYRTRASKACAAYAELRVSGDRASVCRENRSLTGRTYGLLNALQAHFAK